jgi:TolB protein
MKSDLRRASTHYEVPADSLDRFLRRRDRMLRRRRIGTAAVALAIGVSPIVAVVASIDGGADRPVPRASGDGGQGPVERPGRIVFSRWEAGEWHLFSVRPDGSREEQITDGVRDFDPDVSPDGTRIATSTEQKENGLAVMNLDGTGSQTFPVGYVQEPSWSPDGSRIAFALDSGGDNCCLELWMMNADGSGLERLGTERGSAPAWSPDGARIAFLLSGDGLEGATRVSVMNADGTDVTPISEPGWWETPDWSPDGTAILSSIDRGFADAELLTMSPDGGRVDVIGRLPLLGAASWSPDGGRIAYVSRGSVWVMDADGSNVDRLTPPGDNVENPAWG